jgi:hypothetical protein
MFLGIDRAATAPKSLSNEHCAPKTPGKAGKTMPLTKGGSLCAWRARPERLAKCEINLNNDEEQDLKPLESTAQHPSARTGGQAPVQPAIYPSIFPFTAVSIRQSHFRLRPPKHHASVDLCLITGLENPFLPRSSSFCSIGSQSRAPSTGSRQEVRHRIHFRHPGICRVIHQTP